MRLKDKVILVTGSTTGIGEAIAKRVLAEGGFAMFQGRNAERGQALAKAAGDRAVLWRLISLIRRRRRK